MPSDRLRPDSSGHSSLNRELQEERRKRQELLRFAQEGEDAAQEVLSDLACERTLRIKADARIIQLEDRIDDRERSLDDAFIELRDLRERLFAKDLHIRDLEESLKISDSKVQDLRTEAAAAISEQESLTTRLTKAEKTSAKFAETKAEEFAKVELQLEHALDDLAEECDLRAESDARIDELDASLNAHGREMDVFVFEFKALQDDVSARDRMICDLQDSLKVAERTSVAQQEKASVTAEDSVQLWEARCAELKNVVSRVEAEAQMSAAAHAQKVLKLETKEMQMKTEFQSFELKISTSESKKFSLAVSEAEMSHFEYDAEHCRQEMNELRSELVACRKESKQAVLNHVTPDKSKLCDEARTVVSHPATTERELANLRTEMMNMTADAGACRHEMAELRAELMASRLEPMTCHIRNPDGRTSMAGRLETMSSHERTPEKRSNIGSRSVSGVNVDSSELASYQAECSRLRRDRDKHMRDLDDHVNELTRTRRHVQALESENDALEQRLDLLDRHDRLALNALNRHSRPAQPQLDQPMMPEIYSNRSPDAMDVDVAVHAAALNVAVRAELEAARKNEEQVVAQVLQKEACNLRVHDNQPADAHRNKLLQEASDMRIWNLTSELRTEKAFSVEATNALQDSVRALRDQELLADGLRCKLDMATTSCAAARAARASVTKRAQRNNRVLAVEAPARLASKPLYRNSLASAERSSNLRSRIEEEARLRMSLGLCGSTM